MSLTNRILLAMVAGIALGSLLEWLMGALIPRAGYTLYRERLDTGPVRRCGQSLHRVAEAAGRAAGHGVAHLRHEFTGASSRMGSIAGRTIGLYLFTTCVAVTLGLSAALLIGPGKGVEAMASAAYEAKAAPPLTDTLVNIFPSNPSKPWPKARCYK